MQLHPSFLLVLGLGRSCDICEVEQQSARSLSRRGKGRSGVKVIDERKERDPRCAYEEEDHLGINTLRLALEEDGSVDGESQK